MSRILQESSANAFNEQTTDKELFCPWKEKKHDCI